jgi:hypothetical protein
MERPRSARKFTNQLGTTLHRVKMWLNAPIVSRRHARVESVEHVHGTEPVFNRSSEARSARKPIFQPGTALHRVKLWLNASIDSRRHARVENVEPVHETKPVSSAGSVAALVLHVCWLSIVLGLAIQIVLLAASVAVGRIPRLNPLIVDLTQRVAWSTIVCASISVAMVASKLPASFAGLTGLLSASVGFKVARAVQKGV